MINVINIEKLGKKYKEKVIFNDFCISVGENEFVSIIGKSGQGKSTLLNIIGMLDNDYEGSYFFDNRDVRKTSQSMQARLRNKKLGFIFQNYNLLEDLNVIDNIYLPYCFCDSKIDKEKKQYICEMIKKLQIEDLSKQKVKFLSGGEKQRVAIARALALNPKVILADEPTGNLDKQNTKVVLDLLFKMREMGKSIIMVTHDLSIIDKCDKVIDLSKGAIYDI